MRSKTLQRNLPRIVCILLLFLIISISVYLVMSSPGNFRGILSQVHT